MSTLWIGFGNKARNGKDTAAKVFHAHYPEQSGIYPMAYSLKAYCRVQGWMKHKDGPLLQLVGTEILRQRVDQDIWCKITEMFVNDEKPMVALVPDIRFRNEAKFIKDRGGILVQVIRRNADGTQFIADDRPADHPSEIDLDGYKKWDHTIEADSVGALNAEATRLAHTIMERFDA